MEEPYLSIEGEGIHIGKPMVFIRLAECNLRCGWCDTKYSWSEGVSWRFEELSDVIDKIGCINVSFTGGEPLLQADSLLGMLDRLGRYVTYLNTGGTIWSRQVFEKVDWITCDLKMPSSRMKSNVTVVERLAKAYHEKLQFKIVVTPEDLPHLLNVLNSIPQDIPVTVQPEYYSYGAGGAAELSEWVKAHLQDRANIRVLPQLHRLLWPDRDRKV